MVAAEVTPVTLPFFDNIMPAPRKPTPVTTFPKTRTEPHQADRN